MSFPENRYRVLVAEKDARIREHVHYNLHQEGMEVEVADHARAALEKLCARTAT